MDKYFRKALSDLSDLLSIIAQAETFLEITTLERFRDLTSGSYNELIPDQGFSQISFELSELIINEVDCIAETIWASPATSDDDHSNIRMRIERIARESVHYDRVENCKSWLRLI